MNGYAQNNDVKKLILLIIAFSFLAGCSSINPYNVPEGKGAYLKNRVESIGKATSVYLFKSVVTSTGEESFFHGANTPAEGEETYKIPSGTMTLGLKILYLWPINSPDTSINQ